MKTSKTAIVASVIGYYLMAGAALVEFGTSPSATAERLAHREFSDLQKDEGTLTSDSSRLRRDLRAGASGVAVAKERNFVRQDLLNIALDRMAPAEKSQDLDRDQDLASLVGEWLAATAQKYLEPASRS